MITAGLTKQIEIWTQSEDVNSFGAVGYGHSLTYKMRAELKSKKVAQRFLIGEYSNDVVVFEIRYRSGITEGDLIKYDGLELRIEDVQEIGRKKSLILVCLRKS